MVTHNTYRVFISAVSRELASYRAEVARVLRRKGLEVRDQEHFRQGSATLLEQLRDYIRECDAAIFLIGESCGAFPTEEHVAALGEIRLFIAYSKTGGELRASYTQWEFFLAKHFGRKTYLFISDAAFNPDQPNDESDELRACQRAYRQRIKTRGEHYDVLSTKAKLVEDVLVLPFPDLSPPKAISLPYTSLGRLFKGRDQHLADIRRSFELSGDKHAAAIVGKAVHGLGGVGKTRLAIEYAWRYAEDYTALLFVGGETTEVLQRSLAAQSAPAVLNLEEHKAKEEEVRVAATLDWLAKNHGWLLIVDNIDSREGARSLLSLLPKLRGGHVLITGRWNNWPAQIETYDVGELPASAAIDLLLERTERQRRKAENDRLTARELVEELGYLALALEQAGAYIAQHRLSFAGYSLEWRRQRDKVLSWFDQDAMQYPRSVAVTWQTTFERLSDEARVLLERLAWLAPEPIPELLLQKPIACIPKLQEAFRALSELEMYSLVTRAAAKREFTIHRLVQHVTRQRQGKEGKAERLAESLEWLSAAFPKIAEIDWKTVSFNPWPNQALAAHVHAAVHFADDVGITHPTAQLMADLGAWFCWLGLYHEAEPLLRRSLDITEKNNCAPANLVINLINLAYLLQDTNRPEEARKCIEEARVYSEQTQGPTRSRLEVQLNNVAKVLEGIIAFSRIRG